MGVDPSKKVKRFLSFVNYHPEALHPLGRSTHYPKNFVYNLRYNPKDELYHNLSAGLKQYNNQIRTIEEDNKLMKEFYLMKDKDVQMDFDKIQSMEDIKHLIEQQEYDRIVNNK